MGFMFWGFALLALYIIHEDLIKFKHYGYEIPKMIIIFSQLFQYSILALLFFLGYLFL